MPDFDVVGVGLNATDTMLIVPHFPAYAGKVPFEDEHMSPGGHLTDSVLTHSAKVAGCHARPEFFSPARINSFADDYEGLVCPKDDPFCFRSKLGVHIEPLLTW